MRRMKQLREEAGLSQSRAAIKAGLAPERWNRLESGKDGNPQLRTLSLVAASLGVTVSELLEDHEAPKATGPQLFTEPTLRASRVDSRIGDLETTAGVLTERWNALARDLETSDRDSGDLALNVAGSVGGIAGDVFLRVIRERIGPAIAELPHPERAERIQRINNSLESMGHAVERVGLAARELAGGQPEPDFTAAAFRLDVA